MYSASGKSALQILQWKYHEDTDRVRSALPFVQRATMLVKPMP